ncbi:mechanosensitive ion channel family protein [Haloglomus litoreum]|uniref:mechanosensitive ion channel family protein n=1 Tax=Haloglomus litoreum TaxID=3034026 RepID=UPI0023E7CFD9|nr:mechanosensitive ion channel family protein [Haloglomus sp. DT116]
MTGGWGVLQAGNQAIQDGLQLLPPWFPEPLARLIGALVALAVFYYGSTLVKRLLGRRIARRFRRPSLTRTVLRSIQGAVVLLGILIALRILQVPIGDLALSVTVFSAVAGFVLAPIIGSVVNGLFVLSEQPYEIGDMIYLPDRDVYAFVEDITLRYTKVFTLDNTFLIIPNGSIRERDVVNYSAEDSRTRLSLDVQVTYESDIAEARALIEEAARKTEKVIEGGPDIRIGSARYPAAPTCYIENFADHGVNLRLRYWATEPYKLLTLRSNVQTAVWERLADADVEIAYPHSHLVFDETSGEMRVATRSVDAEGNGAPPDIEPAAVEHDPAAEPPPSHPQREPDGSDAGGSVGDGTGEEGEE